MDSSTDWHTIFAVWTEGGVEMQFQHMRSRQPFGDRDKRMALLEELNSIEGVALDTERVDTRPSFKTEVLADPERMRQFQDIVGRCIEEMRTSR